MSAIEGVVDYLSEGRFDDLAVLNLLQHSGPSQLLPHVYLDGSIDDVVTHKVHAISSR
jgi:hypothetical protein